MPKIVIIQKYIPKYRYEFFNGLREKLNNKGIDLTIFYGQPGRNEMFKNDYLDLDWAIKIPNKILGVGQYELYWQPVLSRLKDADLVIVEQAGKLLINYVLVLQNILGIRKVAFWGHGKNFQETSANLLTEWAKQRISTHAHWWFAYNEISVRVVRELGFPADRITSVQNAIDTRFLTNTLENLTQEQIFKTYTALNLNSQNVGIYSGGMYPRKRLSFLLDALHHIRAQIPDFEMIFIGSGNDAGTIEQAAAKYSWIHYVGPKFGQEKVPYFALAKVLLMPALVGLAVLDSFALETPLITTNSAGHGPEIAYLENGINGMITEDAHSAQLYANRVVQIFQNASIYDQLITNCRIARKKYTIENMIENFANGIELALKQ